MTRKGALIALSLAASVAGCGESQQQAFAVCRMDSLRNFGRMADALDAYQKAADFTMFCMESKGYVVNWPSCPTSKALTPSDAVSENRCYRKLPFWQRSL